MPKRVVLAVWEVSRAVLEISIPRSTSCLKGVYTLELSRLICVRIDTECDWRVSDLRKYVHMRNKGLYERYFRFQRYNLGLN